MSIMTANCLSSTECDVLPVGCRNFLLGKQALLSQCNLPVVVLTGHEATTAVAKRNIHLVGSFRALQESPWHPTVEPSHQPVGNSNPCSRYQSLLVTGATPASCSRILHLLTTQVLPTSSSCCALPLIFSLLTTATAACLE
jgi:hypothetical protein